VKVRGNANPYDPTWEPYYEERQAARIKETQAGWWLVRVLWEAQKGTCPQCHQQMTPETGWQIHHREWRVYGGTDLLENLDLLHPNCHRQVHSRFGQGTQAASCAGRS
jgi:RNA-directed DNA polymerase